VFWLTLEKAITVCFVLSCDALLARSISVSEFGQWQYAFNLASLLGCIGFVAGAEVIVPALARHSSIRSEIISAGGVVRSCFALLTILVTALVCHFVVPNENVRKLTVMAVVIVVVNEAAAICTAYFQAMTVMRPVAACRLTALAIRATLFYVGTHFVRTADVFAVFRWVESALLCVLLVLLVRTRGITWKPRNCIIKIVLFRGVKFLPPIIMMYAFTRIDRIYIEHYLSFASVATYSVAQQFVEQCFMLITIVIQTLAPKYLYTLRNGDEIMRCAAKIAALLVALSCGMVLGTWLIGERFISLVFGHRYADSFASMRILVFAAIPFAIDSVITQLLLKAKAAGYLLLKWSIMVVLAIGVYQFAIPFLGIDYLRYVFLFNFSCMATISLLILWGYRRRSAK
jgi:O-antigen/teichoic acid export membrane protein